MAVGLSVAVVLAACGSRGLRNPAGRQPATRTAVNGFVARAGAVGDQRFKATYRISVVVAYGHVFRGRITVFNWQRNALLFREAPAFSPDAVPPYGHAYEVLERSGGFIVNCSQARTGSRWRCDSERGEGMGAEWLQNGSVAPAAFTLGLSNAVAEAKPHTLFLSRERIGAWAVRCLSFGTPPGAEGRVCATYYGLIVSYRLPTRLNGNVYATADLLSYSRRLCRSVLTPPAKPAAPYAKWA